MNIKQPHIRYEAQLVLIIESIALNDQTLNIAVHNLLGTCGIRICQVCYIWHHHLENTSIKILVNTSWRSDGGEIVRSLLPWFRILEPTEKHNLRPQCRFGSCNLQRK